MGRVSELVGVSVGEARVPLWHEEVGAGLSDQVGVRVDRPLGERPQGESVA